MQGFFAGACARGAGERWARPAGALRDGWSRPCAAVLCARAIPSKKAALAARSAVRSAEFLEDWPNARAVVL